MNNITEIFSGEFIRSDSTSDKDLYKYFNGGTTETSKYHSYNKEGEFVLLSTRGQVGALNYINDKFWLGNSCVAIQSKDSTEFNTKFIYYYLKNIDQEIQKQVSKGSIPAISIASIKNLTIPNFSLQRQLEIVNILDKFNSYLNEANFGLISEIEKCQLQYEYYRNLIFENLANEN